MNEFITIDFETGIYSPESAISIGLVKYHDFQPVDTYYSLIRPPKLQIRRDFTAIHGLTVDDVKDAPDFKQIWENSLYDFLGQTAKTPLLATPPLAAHNAGFDMNVLKAVLEWYNLPIPKLKYFCTCSLARKTWPQLKSHALTSLAKNFGIIYKAHNALDDAMTCGKLVQMAVEKFETGNDLKGLLKAANIRMNVLKKEERKKC